MDTFNNFFKESNEFYDFENIDLKVKPKFEKLNILCKEINIWILGILLKGCSNHIMFQT